MVQLIRLTVSTLLIVPLLPNCPKRKAIVNSRFFIFIWPSGYCKIAPKLVVMGFNYGICYFFTLCCEDRTEFLPILGSHFLILFFKKLPNQHLAVSNPSISYVSSNREQKFHQNTFFKHPNQVRSVSTLSPMGGADSGNSWTAVVCTNKTANYNLHILRLPTFLKGAFLNKVSFFKIENPFS